MQVYLNFGQSWEAFKMIKKCLLLLQDVLFSFLYVCTQQLHDLFLNIFIFTLLLFFPGLVIAHSTN